MKSYKTVGYLRMGLVLRRGLVDYIDALGRVVIQRGVQYNYYQTQKLDRRIARGNLIGPIILVGDIT